MFHNGHFNYKTIIMQEMALGISHKNVEFDLTIERSLFEFHRKHIDNSNDMLKWYNPV